MSVIMHYGRYGGQYTDDDFEDLEDALETMDFQEGHGEMYVSEIEDGLTTYDRDDIERLRDKLGWECLHCMQWNRNSKEKCFVCSTQRYVIVEGGFTINPDGEFTPGEGR